jgi:hypothetical protein
METAIEILIIIFMAIAITFFIATIIIVIWNLIKTLKEM